MDPAIISRIALEVSLPEHAVAAAVALFEKGATAPFVARYRKEATGGMPAAKVSAVEERLAFYQEVLERRAGLLKLASDQKKLTDDLRQTIAKTISRVDLDDLGQVLRPKRRTRGSDALEKGLEPLAEYLWNQEPDAWSLEEHADVFINPDKQVSSRELALQGACDIIAEWLADNLEIRSRLRELYCKEGVVVSSVVPAKAAQKTKYTMYYNRREPVASIPSHRVLAIRRGSKEGVLTTAIECDQAKALELILSQCIGERESVFFPILEKAIRDSYFRILRPIIETQVRSMLKERADREAIRVFQDNLSNLLLTPPAGPMVVLGIDIGKGDEARFAVVDQNGSIVEESAVRLRSQRQAPPKAEKAPVEAPAPPEKAPEAAAASVASETQPAAENSPETAPLPGPPSQAAPSGSEAPQPAAIEPQANDAPQESEAEGKSDLPPSDAAPPEPEGAVAPESAAPVLDASQPGAPAAPPEVASEAPAETPETPAAIETESSGAVLTATPETAEFVLPPTQAEAAAAGGLSETPASSESYLETARAVLRDLIGRHSVKAVAIGNSTAARNLESLVRQILTDEKIENVLITAVNDAGVAIYSTSRVAREELPEKSAATRCAISLARRLQDPLAELVKVDPKLIGVGQYQHDVDQKELHRSLVQTVRSCVNHVGADLNTAGFSLLRYVSGLNDKSTRKIMAARTARGTFPSRAALLEVPGIDPLAFEQAAGFLRIRQGENPLDGTTVHPESYSLVEKMAAGLGVGIADLIGNKDLVSRLKLEDFVTETVGLPTLQDIRDELLRPGRDPRRTFRIAHLREDVKQIGDLKEGMTLEGTVTNVTNFGAFVDIGVHQDGLVHLSQMSNRFIRDPREAVKVGDVVQVKVISIEMETKRIGLSIKALLPALARRRKKPHRKGEPAARSKGAPRPSGAAAPADASLQDSSLAAGAQGAPSAAAPPARRRPPGRDSRRPDAGRRNAGRREAGRRDRDRRMNSHDKERTAEKPAEAPEAAPPQPQGPEPTLQEKIAILQSKCRGIN